MKKSFVVILAAVMLLSTLIACTQKPQTETVTQAVTGKNGEIVTDENGELVTEEVEVQVVTDANGQPVTEIVTDGEGKAVTRVENGEYVKVTQAVTEGSGGSDGGKKSSTAKTEKTTKKSNKKSKKSTTKAPVKKPASPSKPSKLSASSVKEESLVLSWSGVKCSGYQVQYSDDGVNFSYLSKNTSSTKMTVDGLVSYTKYTFRVRAFNKNSAGTSVSKWVKTTATTKAANDKRYITFKVNLPTKANEEDTLIITVDGDEYRKKVNLDGSTVTIKTDKKYKGLVKFKATLKNTGSAYSGKTDKDICEFDLSGNGIYVFDGDDD